VTFPRMARLLPVPLTAFALLLGAQAAGAAAAAPAAPGTGWIRLAHFSPNTPAVDVYLYSFDSPGARLVLHHVAYGTVSPYQPVAAGDYSVAMRAAGAAATSPPVLSTSVAVKAGHAYTVAGMGPESGLRLQVMSDELSTPAGQALVRVIQASLKQQVVTVDFGGKLLAGRLSFATVSPYRAVAPGTEAVTATGSGGDATSTVTLAAGTVHTLVILDGAAGLQIVNLEDAAGSGHMPVGAASTGLGGTAPRAPASPAPWLAVIAAGSLLALGALLAMAGALRPRRQPRPGT